MEQLREQLTNLINNSQLPAECVFYIFKDVFRDLQEQYAEILRQQRILQQQQTEVEEIPPQPQDRQEVE